MTHQPDQTNLAQLEVKRIRDTKKNYPVSDPKRFFLVPIFFLQKFVEDPKFFSVPKLFQTKDFFWSQIFFLQKFVSDTIFLWTQNILVDPKKILDPIFVLASETSTQDKG